MDEQTNTQTNDGENHCPATIAWLTSSVYCPTAVQFGLVTTAMLIVLHVEYLVDVTEKGDCLRIYCLGM